MASTRVFGLRLLSRPRWNSSSARSRNTNIAELLSEPTWSVQSLLSDPTRATDTPKVTRDELLHLHRLSALSEPKSQAEEDEMLKTLHSQLHFVREIQKVDTKGIVPLQAIRDETSEAIEESTIHMDDLQEAFAKEKRVGRNGRIKREKNLSPEPTLEEAWNPLDYATERVGKYFVVRKGRDR